MNEYRKLTDEEFFSIAPVLARYGIHDSAEVSRFIDSKLDKIYDVYLLHKGTKSILKKTTSTQRDKSVYAYYFKDHGFAVPEVLSSFSAGEEHYVQMEFVEGTDARGCNAAEGKRIGEALADIQSYYLTEGGRTETSEAYYNKQIGRHINAIKPFYPEYSAVFDIVKHRFFEVPHTLIHDDFLPINVLLNDEDICIIDWEFANIQPYFLDLGRFAFIYDKDNRLFISKESSDAFLKGYYQRMQRNSEFHITEEEFKQDVVISAFCQYVLFVGGSINKTAEKSSEAIPESIDNDYLKNIMQRLRDMNRNSKFNWKI